MLATENQSSIILVILLVMSVMPVVSFFGHVFTKEGRESLKINPLLMIYYFLIFPFYSYCFWIKPTLLNDYFGLDFIYRSMLYGVFCCVPILGKDPPV